MEPAEIEQNVQNEPFEQRMKRASSVFYDYVLNYSPELLSPQHDSFYDASGSNKGQQTKKIKMQENQNRMNLSYLSQTLVGLASQA